jgi:hypothetical protein
MTLRETYLESFRILLSKCLEATPGDQVLVIYDESLWGFFDDLVTALIERRLAVSFFCLPEAYQRALVEWREERVWLPNSLHSAIGESTLILNLLNGHQDTIGVRKAILDHARPKESRLAHVPGISREVLEILSRSPIDQIVRDSELVAWGLGEAQRAKLVTRDRWGQEYAFEVDLGGWANEPLMSPGVIHPGSWGNIPPGESFWCPDTLRGSGSVCINGSIPHASLAPEEEAILHFEEGRLVGWEPDVGGPVSRFLRSAEEAAQRRDDPHWNAFAELGIGLNPAIERLTGNSLFDEKKAGTIHVAIGDNFGFGFGLRAGIHADMVSVAPSLLLDGREVISEGQLNREALVCWRGDLWIEPLALSDRSELVLHAENFEATESKAMRRLRRASRVGYVQIAEGDQAAWVCEVASALQAHEVLSYGQLRSIIGSRKSNGAPLNNLQLRTALELLAHYEVVEIKTDPTRSNL